MARVIEFYIPHGFMLRRRTAPANEMGKLIEFPSFKTRKSA